MDVRIKNAAAQRLALPEGTILAQRYRIREVRSIGALGITYTARAQDSGDTVCIRECCPMASCGRAEDGTITADDTAALETAKAQFSCLSTLLAQGVPHLPAVTDTFPENGTVYACYLPPDGTPFTQCRITVTPTYVQSLGLMLLDTLETLHEEGFCLGQLDRGSLYIGRGGHLTLDPDTVREAVCTRREDLTRLQGFLRLLSPDVRQFPEDGAGEILRTALSLGAPDAPAMRTLLIAPDGKVPAVQKRTGLGRHALTLSVLVCIFFALVGVYGCIRVWNENLTLHRSFTRGLIHKDVADVWLPLGEDENEEDVVAMYERLAAGFERQYPGYGVNIRLYAEDSMDAALEAACGEVQPPEDFRQPAVFMNVRRECVYAQAADLSMLTQSLEDVYIADLTGFTDALPLGCSLPVLYTADDEPHTTAALDALPEGTMYDATAAAFLSVYQPAKKAAYCFSLFLDDPSAPVLGSTSALPVLEESPRNAGAVHMIPVCVDGQCPVQYEMFCTVNAACDRTGQQIGMLWLQYLLTQEAQEILFVEHYSALPLYESAFEDAVAAHSALSAAGSVQDCLDTQSLQDRR
ncbi:MAG: hypothetical protein IJ055_09850 [Oscillospiraceae bacterium]|nr:hypothetical protein [Oscillospiraceae bacterium]